MLMPLVHFVVSVIKALLVMAQKHVMVCTANSYCFSLQNHVIREMQYVMQESCIIRVLVKQGCSSGKNACLAPTRMCPRFG